MTDNIGKTDRQKRKTETKKRGKVEAGVFLFRFSLVLSLSSLCAFPLRHALRFGKRPPTSPTFNENGSDRSRQAPGRGQPPPRRRQRRGGGGRGDGAAAAFDVVVRGAAVASHDHLPLRSLRGTSPGLLPRGPPPRRTGEKRSDLIMRRVSKGLGVCGRELAKKDMGGRGSIDLTLDLLNLRPALSLFPISKKPESSQGRHHHRRRPGPRGSRGPPLRVPRGPRPRRRPRRGEGEKRRRRDQRDGSWRRRKSGGVCRRRDRCGVRARVRACRARRLWRGIDRHPGEQCR